MMNKSKQTGLRAMKVYHVGNPEVAGYILSTSIYDPQYVNVEFVKPVQFKDHPRTSINWGCNLGLLYTTSEDAKKNSYTYKAKKKKPTGRKLLLD